jgi:hypothetical protein
VEARIASDVLLEDRLAALSDPPRNPFAEVDTKGLDVGAAHPSVNPVGEHVVLLVQQQDSPNGAVEEGQHIIKGDAKDGIEILETAHGCRYSAQSQQIMISPIGVFGSGITLHLATFMNIRELQVLVRCQINLPIEDGLE